MKASRFSTPARILAAFVLIAYFTGCTKQVTRPEIEARHFSVDWSASGAESFTMSGISVRGIVLTPAQWPMEGSLKRLLTGDFVGVIDSLNLTFRSSTLPDGVLRDIFDAGFLPVYVQIYNQTAETRGFFPELLAVKGEPQREFSPVPAASLPEQLTEIDWKRTAVVTLATLLLVVVIVASGRGDSNGQDLSPLADVSVQVITSPNTGEHGGFAQAIEPPPTTGKSEPGLLEAGVLAPGETMEGFVFFAHKGQTVDWSTVKLAQ